MCERKTDGGCVPLSLWTTLHGTLIPYPSDGHYDANTGFQVGPIKGPSMNRARTLYRAHLESSDSVPAGNCRLADMREWKRKGDNMGVRSKS